MSGARYVCLEQRLIANTYECPETGCWVWTGKVDKDGYPIITIRVAVVRRKNRRKSEAVDFPKQPHRFRAHRIAYELFHEVKLLPEQTLDHRCLNRRCIHPNHTFVMSAGSNTRLMWARRRFVAANASPAPF